MALEPGMTAPAFSLASTEGADKGAGGRVSLASLKGRKVVLYFYPKDDTPGCTREACGFRDMIGELEEAGARVLGVSPDDVESHREFREKYKLPFTLLADPGHAVAEKYGVWKEKLNYGKKYMGIERTTFVIDSAGKIAKIFPRVKVDGHAEKVLAAVREAE